MRPCSPKPSQRSQCQRGSRCPQGSITFSRGPGRDVPRQGPPRRPGAGSPGPMEREKKVKPPRQALARDVKAGNFRGVMFASL